LVKNLKISKIGKWDGSLFQKILNIFRKRITHYLKECVILMLKNIIIGASAGIISGLFGAGGGLILVPVLVHYLKLSEKEARATTIFCILPMVITSGIIYYNNDLIDWSLAIKCAIGGIIGSFIGTKLLRSLSNSVLKISFIVFLIYVAIKYLI